MDSKNLTIIPPKGMEAYQEGNEIKFHPIEEKTVYKDVARRLFYGKTAWYISNEGGIRKLSVGDSYYHPNNCTSEKQAQKLLAINHLMNVAKYLNGDWQPNWGNNDGYEYKYYLFIDYPGNKIEIAYVASCCSDGIYFKSEELAQQAIDILGEEAIKLALSTDW